MNSKYFRGYRDPHKGLKLWTSIARSLPELTVMRVPMHIPEEFDWLRKFVFVQLFFKLWGHFVLVRRIFNIPNGTILVREFLTAPFLLISPFLYWRRQRIWLMCQHNVAHAQNKIGHRMILRWLQYLGYGFVVFENGSSWKVIEPDTNRHARVRAIPHPLNSYGITDISKRNFTSLTIGFVGSFRKEKSPDWALDLLASALASNPFFQKCKLLIGAPDAEFRVACSKYGRVVDTGSYTAYLDALNECDVVVLPYDPTSYFYRCSGVLADALTCGCAVVAPDVPTLRNQILDPTPVGACYVSRAEFIDAVESAVELVRSRKLDAALRHHYSARGSTGTYTALLELTK